MLKMNTEICYGPIANEFIQIKVSNSLTFELFDTQDCFSNFLLLLWEKLILLSRQRGPKSSVDVSKATESVTTGAQVGN